MKKWPGHHYVNSTDISMQFRVQNTCYAIIPDKQILKNIKNIQYNFFPSNLQYEDKNYLADPLARLRRPLVVRGSHFENHCAT
jgi:hypothetical protein